MKLIKKLFRTVNRLVSNKVIKWIIIPSALLLLWFTLSLAYSSYRSFTVLQYPQNQDAKNNLLGKKLLKGQNLSGEFKAKENNLGIIAVKFRKVPKVNFENESRMLFRIKEKGQANWFYENKYRSSLVRPYQYLTFGFIPIQNSKGKTYEFEIVSLNGNINNVMETTNTNPAYLSKYKFSKGEVFKNWESILKFIMSKILTFYTDYDTLVSASVFLLPFIFYLTWIIFVEKIKVYKNPASNLKLEEKIAKVVSRRELILYYLRNFKKKIDKIVFNRKTFTFLIFTLIFNDIFFSQNLVTGFMLGFLGFWIFAIYLNNFHSGVTFTIAFIIILLSVFSIYYDWKISVDKTSTYAFMFIVIGLLQILLRHKNTYIRN